MGRFSKAFLHWKLISLTRKNRYAGGMSTASFSPAAARAAPKLSLRRLAAWLYARAVDPRGGGWLVICFSAAPAVLGALVLVNFKVAQGVHMAVAEWYD